LYRSLESDRIIKTVCKLKKRISERFMDSNLNKVCSELLSIAKETEDRCNWIAKKNIFLRIVIGIVIILILGVLTSALLSIKIEGVSLKFAEFVGMLEAGMNAVVIIGAAILFLITVETRFKRSRALKSLHELRVICHVIDMHQLTKDPERTLTIRKNTVSSPKSNLNLFELSRYLDYCTEMLSLIGKIAALYAQKINDPIVINTVNDLEILTTGLSRKIWQKIMVLQVFEKNIKKK
jgi:hypothetical protein